jgi:hypothetical protein
MSSQKAPVVQETVPVEDGSLFKGALKDTRPASAPAHENAPTHENAPAHENTAKKDKPTEGFKKVTNQASKNSQDHGTGVAGVPKASHQAVIAMKTKGFISLDSFKREVKPDLKRISQQIRDHNTQIKIMQAKKEAPKVCPTDPAERAQCDSCQ